MPTYNNAVTHSTRRKKPVVDHENSAQHTGRTGEDIATQYLISRGYSVLETNAHFKNGEIDIVAKAPNGECVFAEVKTRRGISFGAAESVGAHKMRRMKRAASAWLKEQTSYIPHIRFDVIVVALGAEQPVIDHYEGVEHGAR